MMRWFHLARTAAVSGALFGLGTLLCPIPRAAAGPADMPASVPALVPAPAITQGGGVALAQFDSLTGSQTDIVFGGNRKGPYPLSWKGMRAGSDVVSRDGQALHRNTDYTLDMDAGALTFTDVLGPNQMVRITYRVDTLNAAPNPTSVSLPLQWDLWQQGQNRFSLSSVYRPGADVPGGSNSGSPLNSALQFSGGAHWLPASTLTSALYVDLHGGDWLGRSGLRVADQTHLRYANFGVSYQRAGALFSQKDPGGLKAGAEILETTGSLTPLRGLALNALFRQTTALPDTSHSATGASAPSQGTVARVIGDSVALTLPHNDGKIEAGRTVTDTMPPDGTGLTQTDDTVKVNKVLAKGTEATTVTYEAHSTKTDAGTPGAAQASSSYSQTTGVDFKTQPNKQLTVTGTFRSALGTTGAQDTAGLNVEATPIARLKQLKLKAAWQDQYGAQGAQRSRSILVDLPTLPLAKTQVSGGFRQNSAPGQENLTGLIDTTTHPVRYLEVDGGVRLRDGMLAGAPDPNAVNTYNLKMALAPSKLFKLTGTVAENPEKSDGSANRAQTGGLGLDTQVGPITFHGQYGLENDYLANRLMNTLTLGLDLRLTRWDTITTGYEGRSVLDANVDLTDTYRLGFSHHLNSIFDVTLSGEYTQHELNGMPDSSKPDVKARADVGVHF